MTKYYQDLSGELDQPRARVAAREEDASRYD
jgi:hypothetical protein